MKPITLMFACFCFLNSIVSLNDARSQVDAMAKDNIVFAGFNFGKPRVGPGMQSQSFLDTLYTFPTPGTWPTGLAWDGVSFWNSDADSQRIYKLNLSGQVLKSFPQPAGCADLTWDGTNLWLVNEQAAHLFKLDTSNGSVLASFRLPDSASLDPNSFGLAWDGSYLWHSQYGSQARIFKLNPASGQEVSSFVPPTNSILGIEWVNGFLYGVSINFVGSSLIYKFDPSSGIVLDSASWEVPYPLGLIWDGSHFWNVSSATVGGGWNRICQVSSPILSVSQNMVSNVPLDFVLFQNYPNPFNPSTMIQYELSRAMSISLKIYSILGEEVATLINYRQSAGSHTIQWNPDGVPTGVYYYRMQSESFTQTKQLILLR